MSGKKVYRAIGLMSGTSLDGVDAALLETDGFSQVRPLGFVSVPYTDEAREDIRAAFGRREHDDVVQQAEALVTRAHIDVVQEAGWQADVIGFHGQTIFHAPEEGLTVQIGDAALMARETGVDVVADFRSADVKAGGQGAPLAPLYHQARVMAAGIETPCTVLNIGGVANVTWVGEERILAFDTGPGNALMDDWARARLGQAYDEDGALAAKGTPVQAMLENWLAHPYFAAGPPKSLDRNEWDIADFGRVAEDMTQISDEDGAATLLAFTTQTIVEAKRFMPEEPKTWYVCGGGRHNMALMDALAQHMPVRLVEDLGWNGDAIEAECFAYLAVRSLLGEPLGLPSTTGVKMLQTGGVFYEGG